MCNVTVILLFVFWHGGLFVFEVTSWHFKLWFDNPLSLLTHTVLDFFSYVPCFYLGRFCFWLFTDFIWINNPPTTYLCFN